MAKSIVILTGDSLRHEYLRMVLCLADGVDVLKSYCESSIDNLLENACESGDSVKVEHLERRARSEHDYFAPFVNIAPDRSNPVTVSKGSINDEKYYREITDLDPDLLVAYGCSIIEDPLLNEYSSQIVNLHLGLSPYYRGTGTNFWALVDGKPEYVGGTFMYMDAGIDTGEIIHQLRARVQADDGPHDIGHRLIADAAQVYPELIRNFEDLHSIEQLPEPDDENYYTSSDFSTAATRTLYENFADGLVEEYLAERDQRVAAVPILKHPEINEDKVLTEPKV